jgi:hypothetical protein
MKSDTKIPTNDKSNIGTSDSISSTDGYYKFVICYFISNSKYFLFSFVANDVVDCSLQNNDSVFDVPSFIATNQDEYYSPVNDCFHTLINLSPKVLPIWMMIGTYFWDLVIYLFWIIRNILKILFMTNCPRPTTLKNRKLMLNIYIFIEI